MADIYKIRGEEKAEKIKNKRYVRRKHNYWHHYSAGNVMYLKSRGYNPIRGVVKTRLNDPNEWDEFQMPRTKHCNSKLLVKPRNVCRDGWCQSKFRIQKFY